ncbi:hypothetical protein [Rufibacter sp. LB8]|uniref:hypothetical protein n=1 Tax=Rufibacter sp. LB8 TaxID=2777781 RepID=UPI00178C6460|nr:hypothetical protein [Rufibacter sp. LB8]
MKTVLSFLFLLVWGSFTCSAQMSFPRQPAMAGITQVGSSFSKQEPLLFVGDQETSFKAFIAHQKDMVILKMYTDSTILAPLGQRARGGIVTAELKSKRPLFRLEHVLDYFNVPTEKRSLNVLVNKQPVTAHLVLADITQIKKVEVIKLDATSPVRSNWDANAEYLNIVTKD